MALLVRVPASCVGILGSRPARHKIRVWTMRTREGVLHWCRDPDGSKVQGVNVTDVYARGVNVNLTPLTSNRGALATDARGCSLWRYLLERPPPAWESWVRDPLGTRYEFGLCGPGRGCYIYIYIYMKGTLYWKKHRPSDETLNRGPDSLWSSKIPGCPSKKSRGVTPASWPN